METDRRKEPGIFIGFGYRIPIPEGVRLIREAGVKTVLHWWETPF